MNTSIDLKTVHSYLTDFAGLESFWQSFDTVFGVFYDRVLAQKSEKSMAKR